MSACTVFIIIISGLSRAKEIHEKNFSFLKKYPGAATVEEGVCNLGFEECRLTATLRERSRLDREFRLIHEEADIVSVILLAWRLSFNL